MILTINYGSSTIKYSLYDYDTLMLLQGNTIPVAEGMQEVFAQLEVQTEKQNIKAVGHRIVHGGTKYLQPVLLTSKIIDDLKTYIPLAPTHQPYNLEAVKLVETKFPNVPQIGCFDTQFHHTQHQLAKLFAIPQELTNEGIIRYGFHGLSYEFIANVLPDYLDKIGNEKVIVAHLGQGSSMCAIFRRKSVATTMGFSSLDGLMMGSRCGRLDPGVLIYLLEVKKLKLEEVKDILYNKSGLLGVSGISSDLRELINNKAIAAQLAVELYCYRAATELSGLATAIQGCDAIVFTGGVGEHSAPIRAKICRWLKWMGVEIDEEFNNSNKDIISNYQSKIVVSVIQTDEENVIAKHVKSIMNKS